MNPGFQSNAVLLNNYVLVSAMDWVAAGDWEHVMDWDCECGGPMPPMFNLPPPPVPPPLPDAYGVLQEFTDCEVPWTCPVYHATDGGLHEDYRSGASVEAPLAVVIISAVVLVLLVLLPVIIICRLRCRRRSSKGCSAMNGAIIYDDLPSAPSYVPARGTRVNTRHKPMHIRRDDALTTHLGLHLYSPEPRSRPHSEHLYQSISSGSDTCSYSNSEAIHRNGHLMMPSSPYHHSPSNYENDDDSEMEPLAPSQIGDDSDDTPIKTNQYIPRHISYQSPIHNSGHSPVYKPNRRPSHTSLQSPYCSPEHQVHAYIPSAPERSPSPSGESVYYVSGSLNGGRPLTPQERGLPPLPSRSDKFRIYFSTDRNVQMHNRPSRSAMPPIRRSVSGLTQTRHGYGAPVRRWQSDANRQRMLHPPLRNRERSPQKQPEEEPLYENMP